MIQKTFSPDLAKYFVRALVMLPSLLAPAVGADTGMQNERDRSRGELLYTTHCTTCHASQVHWRDRKLVSDQAGLQAQVRRWQQVIGLNWGDEDIAAVALFLSARYYHLPD